MIYSKSLAYIQGKTCYFIYYYNIKNQLKQRKIKTVSIIEYRVYSQEKI